MNYRLLLYVSLTICTLFMSCSDDEEKSCVVCESEFVQAFELCRESDGTASVEGENTGTDYDTYLRDLQETGTTCGGGE